ncbi:hypothetical protein AGDE_14357 [Angomonas deanei]|nr:hypothetical protein AGDE_14357 [Angomonas deanei]|eukprot:EPY21001.1 hypothetical protein AGDE_14357 [Angomonas deanei]
MISNANGVLLLRKIRTHLETHLRCYDAVRDAARRAAQQVGWYAVSAQWRDQVLHKLESLAETDWYNLSDCGSKYPFRFPNYGKTR